LRGKRSSLKVLFLRPDDLCIQPISKGNVKGELTPDGIIVLHLASIGSYEALLIIVVLRLPNFSVFNFIREVFTIIFYVRGLRRQHLAPCVPSQVGLSRLVAMELLRIELAFYLTSCPFFGHFDSLLYFDFLPVFVEQEGDAIYNFTAI